MEIQIVGQLRDLAQDPRNRATIVEDQGCLPGLVLFLDNQNKEVVRTAVEALSLLAECKKNRPTMWKETGLVESLNDILEASTSASETCELARTVLGKISPSSLNQAKKAVGQTRAPFSPQVNSASNVTPMATPTKNFFRPGVNKIARTVTLQVAGMDDMRCRKMVEANLLEVKGVVSFTFEMKSGRVVVRSRTDVTVEALCAAIDSTKIMTAQQVVKDEHGQEVMLSFGSSPAKFADGKENGGMPAPQYLDEEEEVDAEASKKTLAKVGGSENESWFGKIGGLISNSLYW